jgi:hypothetical protein
VPVTQKAKTLCRQYERFVLARKNTSICDFHAPRTRTRKIHVYAISVSTLKNNSNNVRYARARTNFILIARTSCMQSTRKNVQKNSLYYKYSTFSSKVLHTQTAHGLQYNTIVCIIYEIHVKYYTVYGNSYKNWTTFRTYGVQSIPS